MAAEYQVTRLNRLGATAPFLAWANTYHKCEIGALVVRCYRDTTPGGGAVDILVGSFPKGAFIVAGMYLW